MNPNFRAKYISLDWDDISIGECERRIEYIKNLSNVQKFTIHLSPTKGYHVRLWFYGFVHVANMRKALKDDGKRLVNDILNRSGSVHDILWSRKTISGITWEEKLIYSYRV